MSEWDDYIVHVNAQGTFREQFLIPHRQGITLCKKADCLEVRVYFWDNSHDDYCKYITVHLADLLNGLGVKVDLSNKIERPEPEKLAYNPEELVNLQKEMGLLSDSFTGFTEAAVKDTTGINEELYNLRQEFSKLRKEVNTLRYEFDRHTIHNSEE